MVDSRRNSVFVLHKRTNNQLSQWAANPPITMLEVAVALCGASSGEVEEASVIALAPFLRCGFCFPALAFPISRFGEEHEGFS
jgi:hypothetical protein